MASETALGRCIFSKTGEENFEWCDGIASNPPPLPPFTPSFVQIRMDELLSGGASTATAAAPVQSLQRSMLHLLALVAQRDTEKMFCWTFVLQVDPSQLLNYQQIVPNPLDLSTIASRVISGFYATKGDAALQMLLFEDDLLDTFLNCCCYHPPRSPFFVAATKILSCLSDDFKVAGLTPVRAFLGGNANHRSVRCDTSYTSRADSCLNAMRELAMLTVLERVQSRDILGLLNVDTSSVTIFPHHPVSLSVLSTRVANRYYLSFHSFQRDLDLFYCNVAASILGDNTKKLAVAALRHELYKHCSSVLMELYDKHIETNKTASTAVAFVNGSVQISPPTRSITGFRKRENPWMEERQSDSLPAEVQNKFLTAICEWQQSDTSRWFSVPFLDPAYFSATENPMDIMTIKYKLTKGLYTNEDQIHSDVDLLADNCVMFNGPGNSLSKEVTNLTRLWKQLLPKYGISQPKGLAPL